MPKPLRLFTDGSHDQVTGRIGWGYVLVAGDTVLLADCGECDGESSRDAEFHAVIHGLLAIPSNTKVRVICDMLEIAQIGGGNARLGKKKYRRLRVLMHQLLSHELVDIEYVESGKHPYNKYADTLARRAIDLESKHELKRRRRRKSNKKKLTTASSVIH